MYSCIYIYIYTHICTLNHTTIGCVPPKRYQDETTSSNHMIKSHYQITSSSNHIKSHHQTTRSSSWILPHSVLRKSNTASLLHVHPPSLFAPAPSPRFSPVCQCVCIILYIYKYVPTLARWPPRPLKTHTKEVLFVYFQTHRPKKTRQEQKRETKRKWEVFWRLVVVLLEQATFASARGLST